MKKLSQDSCSMLESSCHRSGLQATKNFLVLNLGKITDSSESQGCVFLSSVLLYGTISSFIRQTSIEPLILSGPHICQCFKGKTRFFFSSDGSSKILHGKKLNHDKLPSLKKKRLRERTTKKKKKSLQHLRKQSICITLKTLKIPVFVKYRLPILSV